VFNYRHALIALTVLTRPDNVVFIILGTLYPGTAGVQGVVSINRRHTDSKHISSEKMASIELRCKRSWYLSVAYGLILHRHVCAISF